MLAQQKRPGSDHLMRSAENFIRVCQNQDGYMTRDQLVKQAATHLMETYDVTYENAGMIGVQALSNLECYALNASINIDHSTSSCIVLRIDGRLRAISLIDILKLFEDEPEQDMATMNDCLCGDA